MPLPVDFHDWRPTVEQELVLKAALLEGQGAAEAVRAWAGSLGARPLDAGIRRLLPLVYRNLAEQRIRTELSDDLRKAYRETWARNQVLLSRLRGALKILHTAGIKTLVLKGASLSTRFYRDPGLRPMKDLDVLVPTACAEEAVDVLGRNGWSPERKPDGTFSRYVSVNHGVRLWDSAGTELDLHWHVLNECLAPRADDGFWHAAVGMEIDGVHTLVLCATDELLHTCIHGVRWNPVPPIRWIADAHKILTGDHRIDWDRLVAQAIQRRLSLTLKAALGYLREEFEAAIPGSTMGRLETVTVSKEEMREWRSRLNRPGWTLQTPPFLWAHYPRFAKDSGRIPGIFGFLQYLQAVWDLDYAWQVPLQAIWRSAQRLFYRQPS